MENLIGDKMNNLFNDYDKFVDKFKPKKTTGEIEMVGAVRTNSSAPDELPEWLQ